MVTQNPTTMATLAERIATACEWRKTVNANFAIECELRINKCERLLPHGSGIDAGCKIDRVRSGKRKIIIEFLFHHLNEGGFYDGWTDHKAIITPEFGDISVWITGRDKNGVKDYLAELFQDNLNSEQL